MSVEVAGLAKREVRIDLDPDRLRAYAITPAQLAEFTENGEGPVATTELVFRPYNSTPIVQTDCFTVVFD